MCTCNERQKHVVATRRTADDVVIKLWSSGEITTNFGAIPKSVGKSQYAYVRAQAVRANWLIDFALYDWRELSVVITAYRKELRKVATELHRGQLIVMRSTTQEHWEHTVPKAANAGSRINLTFRTFLTT